MGSGARAVYWRRAAVLKTLPRPWLWGEMEWRRGEAQQREIARQSRGAMVEQHDFGDSPERWCLRGMRGE